MNGGTVLSSGRFSFSVRYWLVFGGGLLLLVAMLLLNITQGIASVDIRTVIEAVVAPQDVPDHHIIARQLFMPYPNEAA
ncbi:hypothetical protein [Cohnella sp.]|uniref:hypothetical protein n=1 Tax=Cohnella sp. TaxID=1883426 RepID=UPI003567E241